MATAKIVYASLTGNTQEIAEILADNLRDLDVEVDVSECSEANAAEFYNYDICIVATYTYGYGDLPDEIVPFYEDLEGLDLSGKIAGVVGSGDLSYDEMYCKSVDDFVEQFENANATIGAESVKIEFNTEGEDYDNLEAFAQSLVDKLP